jgi:hypothetical protein
MKTTIYCTLILLLALCSCTVETLPDEELTIKQEAYTGNQLRMDGFYKGLQTGQTLYYDFIFIYSNGITFCIGHKNVNSISDMDKDIDAAVSIKDHWGLFQIHNDSVYIQRWRARETVIQYLLTNYQYKIINDTTLYYKNSYGETTYRFVKYSPKPDSTNTFIK